VQNIPIIQIPTQENHNNTIRRHEQNPEEHQDRQLDISIPSSNEDTATWRQKKEFRQILGKRNVTKFSGDSPQEYARWKKRLQEEVEDLNLSPQQWLELLEARTTSIALDTVKTGDTLREELGAKATLRQVWKFLDTWFVTQQEHYQDLLQSLQEGPTIPSNDDTGLWAFSMDCQKAVCLMDNHETLKLILNEETTQKAIA
jgi:hypothetical protein